MELKRYQAESMAEALEKVKKDLGRDAVILHTRTIRRGGVLGIGARSIIEITASRDLNVLPPSERKAIIGRRAGQGAYATGRAPMESPSDPKPHHRWSQPNQSRPQAGPPMGQPPRELRNRSLDQDGPTHDLTRDIERPQDLDLYTPFSQPRPDAGRRRTSGSPNPPHPARGESLSNPLRSTATPEMTAFTSSMQREMGELRSMVHQLLSRSQNTGPARPPMAPQDVPGDLQQVYTDLIQNEVAEEFACDVIARAHERIEAARTALRQRNEQRKARSETKAVESSEAVSPVTSPATGQSAQSSASGTKRKRTTKKNATKSQTEPATEVAGLRTPDMPPDAAPKKGLNEQEALREIVPVILQEVIEQMIPEAEPVQLTPGQGTRCVALTGPTGVGKTTTIAKLAAHFKLREGKNVGLITIDTYRIAAVDQLRAYAEILNVPLEVVLTPEEMTAALERMQGYDLVLIDTSGRSQRDTHRLSELRTFLDVARRTIADRGGRLETHLVLSCIAHPQQLAQVTERFSVLGLDRVVFTKLDEAVGLGVILNTIRRLNVKLSYLTTGQDVPDHLEIGHRRRIAELVLKGFPEDRTEDLSLQGATSVDDIA